MLDHFDKHVIDVRTRCFTRLRVPTPEIMCLRADSVVGRRGRSGVHFAQVNSVKRPARNDRFQVFDERTDELVVVSNDGYIISYYIPIPGLHHQYSSNLDYFKDTCRH